MIGKSPVSQVFTMSKPNNEAFRHQATFARPVDHVRNHVSADDDEETDDDEVSFLQKVEAKFGKGPSTVDSEATMNASLALNDLATSNYVMPLRAERRDSKARFFSSFRRKAPPSTQNPIRSILRNSSKILLAEHKARGLPERTKSDKRLSFALSPTFISDSQLPIRKTNWNDSLADGSMQSLGEDLFPAEEPEPAPSKQEGSMVLGDGSISADSSIFVEGPSPGRRSSLTEYKSKSSLGFDERFVGLHESDLGSIGNSSWSSI